METKTNIIILIIMGIVLIGAIVYMNINKETIPEFPQLPSVDGQYTTNTSDTYLSSGWNMISLPSSGYKYSIIINYNENSYVWNQAIDEGLIADVVLSYKNNNYVNIEYLIKTRGYWIYCYVDGIYISDEPFTLYCGKIEFGSQYDNITCQKVVIAPEFYSNTIYCNTLQATDTYTFYYMGGEILHG